MDKNLIFLKLYKIIIYLTNNNLIFKKSIKVNKLKNDILS